MVDTESIDEPRRRMIELADITLVDALILVFVGGLVAVGAGALLIMRHRSGNPGDRRDGD